MEASQTARSRAVRRVAQGVVAVVGSVALVATTPPVVHAQNAPQDSMADFAAGLPDVPGQPALPDVPGLGQTGGAQGAVDAVEGGIDTAFPGAIKKQNAQAPGNGQEESTAPPCAPNVFIGVPGTFEVNRDSDPSQPVGLLGDFMAPIRDTLGDQLSETYINYDGDAGVNGTSYQRSVDGATRKALVTAADVADRCDGSQIFLGGFSQGAAAAGNVAEQIGQRQSQVDPGRVGGTILFSDPNRDQNANLIVGTRAQQPTLPDILSGAIDNAMKDPSLAQLRSNAKPLADFTDQANNFMQDFVQGPPSKDSKGSGGNGSAGEFSTTEKNDDAAGQNDTTETDSGGNEFKAPESGGNGFNVPNSGGTSGGTSKPNTSGGGLGPAAMTGDATFHDTLLRPDGEEPSIVTAEYNESVGDAMAMFVQNDTSEDAPVSEDEAAEIYISGGCGAQSLSTCTDTGLNADTAASTENPYADDLRAAVEAADGDSTADKLESVCGDRLSAEVCGGSQLPSDAVTDKDSKPEDASGIVVVPNDFSTLCEDSDGSCYGGVSILESTNPEDFPEKDADVKAYWSTPALQARTKELQSNSIALQQQATARMDAKKFDEGDTETQVRIPEGVTSIVNTADGTSRDLKVEKSESGNFLADNSEGDDAEGPVAAPEIGALFDDGWVLGRSESEEKSLPSVIEGLYRGGGCDDKSLDDCAKAFEPGSGQPEAAMPVGQINARAVHAVAAEEAPELPDDFAETCLTKTVDECAEGGVSQDVPSLPAVSEAQPQAPTDESAAGEESEATSTPETSELVDASEESTSPVAPANDEDGEGEGDESTGESSTVSESEPAEPTSQEMAAGQAGDTTSSSRAAAGEESSDDEYSSSSAPSTATSTAADQGAADSTGSNTSGGGLGGGAAAGGEATSSSAQAAGEEASESTTPADSGDSEATEPTPSAAPDEDAAGGGESESGGPVPVDKLTLGAVSGGGLAGPRDSDFGALTGRVVSLCVPGDIVCSLPEDSQLARSLVDLGKNVSLDMNELASAEGATRMGGLLAVQAVDTVLEVTGMPRLKLSPETIEALIKIVAGVGLIAAGNQPAGAGLIASVLPQLPQMLPEVAAQLQDLPKILEALPDAPEKAAENLGLVNKELNRGFEAGGLSNPGDLTKLPQMLPGMLNALAEDNSGLLEIAQNPAYYTSGEHHVAFDTLQVSGEMNGFDWSAQWFTTLGKEKAA